MQTRHWGAIIVALIVGYALAMYFPQPGQKVSALISGS